MQKVCIRIGTVSDVGMLNKIRLASIESSFRKYPNLIAEGQKKDWIEKDSIAKLTEYLDDPERTTLILSFQDQCAIGYCTFIKNELERLFISAEHQGKGLGHILMNEAERQMLLYQKRTKGPPLLKVDSFVTSRPFYEKRGYGATSLRKFKLPNSTIYTYWMIKDVGDSLKLPSYDMPKDELLSEMSSIDSQLLGLLSKRDMIVHCLAERSVKGVNGKKSSLLNGGDSEGFEFVSKDADSYAISEDIIIALQKILGDRYIESIGLISETNHI